MPYAGITNKTIQDYIGIVKIDNTEYLTGSTLFGICKTAANVAIKDVEIEDFDDFNPTHGLTIHVLFYYSNTANSPSLRIGGTTESHAYYTICATRGNAAGATIADSWREGAIVSLTFVDSRYDDDSTTESNGETDLSNSYWLINSSMDTGADPASTINWSNVTGASDLHAIEDLDSSNNAATGYLKRTGTNTWALQTTVPDDISTVPGITTVGASGGAAAYSHTHGNITNDGTIGRTNNWSLENGDGLLVFDSNNSNKIERSSITFDGSTATKALTKAGSWQDFIAPYGTKTQNYVFAAPSDANGTPDFRALVSADIPESVALTGTPTATTAADGTNTTQIATTAFVQNTLKYADAMIFKGTVDGGTSSTNYTPAADRGHTYKVATAGLINGETVEVGDILICTTDSTAQANSTNIDTIKTKWVIIQTNIDGAVIGPASSTANHIATFSDTGGKVIKDSGLTATTETTGFKISGGTTSKSLTIDKDISGISDSSSAGALSSSSTKLVTERDVYYGLPKINNAHNYTSSTTIYAPTGGGSSGQYLKANGSTSTPTWATFEPATVGLNNVSNNATLNGATGNAGDLIYWNDESTPAPTRLTKGTANQVLTIDAESNLPTWKDNQATDQNVSQQAYDTAPSSSTVFNILFKNSAGDTGETAGVKFSMINGKKLTFDPYDGTLSAASFNGALSASAVKAALGTEASNSLTFLHKSGDWKTLNITNTTTTVASVSGGILTLVASVKENATLGMTAVT